jgi:integrase
MTGADCSDQVDPRARRAINKAGRVWGDGMSPKVLWDVVRAAAARAGIDRLAPHDLRRTCARLCHLAGRELHQIQFLLGHVSIQTTERYLGGKRMLQSALGDYTGSIGRRRVLNWCYADRPNHARTKS